MIDLSHKIEISAAPQRVWNALVGFSSYPKWNPFVAVRTVGTGNRIEWSFARAGATRRVWQAGLITAWDGPYMLSWRIGISPIFVLHETYSLMAKHGGTVLQHSISCRGMVVALLRPLIRRRLRLVLSAADHGLQRYLSPAITLPKGHAKNISAHRGSRKRRRPRVR